jgi:hypothetical protein
MKKKDSLTYIMNILEMIIIKRIGLLHKGQFGPECGYII